MSASNQHPEDKWLETVACSDHDTRFCEWCGKAYLPYPESEAAGVNVCPDCNTGMPGEGEL